MSNPVGLEPEVCICAAIRLADGGIVRGHRHNHCIDTAIAMGLAPHNFTQGFITSRNRYVDRYEARRLQDSAGIMSVALGGYRGGQLYSEDLY